MAAGRPLLGEITVEVMDMMILGDLRDFMERVQKMPNDAQISFIPASSTSDGDIGGGVKASWQTRNPL